MHDAHLQRARLLLQQGRNEEAVRELRLQLGQESENAGTHSLLALALTELEQHSEAAGHAEQAIHLAPDSTIGHYALARVMLGRNRYEEARAAILEAIRLDPYDADFYGILAATFLQQRRWREALQSADQGLEIDPEHSLCTNFRAESLVKLGDRAGAAKTIGDALARRPDDAYTHANQGWALLHEGKHREALEHFREALRIDPELAWAQAGIVEAMKARNILYRWMLAWFLWVSRLSTQVQWFLVIGGLFGQRIIRQQAELNPRIAPLLWLIFFAYVAFVVLTWLASPFFNLLLRFNRFGRYALSADQVRGANVLAVTLSVTLLLLARWIAGHFGFLGPAMVKQSSLLGLSTLLAGLLALPAAAIFVCDPGWPRQAMAAITVTLAGAVAYVAIIVSFPLEAVPKVLGALFALLVFTLPWALLGSQFAANYLIGVTVKK